MFKHKYNKIEFIIFCLCNGSCSKKVSNLNWTVWTLEQKFALLFFSIIYTNVMNFISILCGHDEPPSSKRTGSSITDGNELPVLFFPDFSLLSSLPEMSREQKRQI